jgi:hypothetical protein
MTTDVTRWRRAAAGARVMSPTRVEWPRQGVTMWQWSMAPGKRNVPRDIDDRSSIIQLF